MIPWRSRQQFKYFFLVSTLLLIAGVAGLFFYANTPGSCSDGTQNNDELGVDCGGSCARLCASEVSAVITHWARAFPVRDALYDAAALIENPNFDAGVRAVSYSFKLYDAKNLLVGERTGKTYLNPGERFVLYENGISARSGANAPQRTFFEFTGEIVWETTDAPREQEVISRDTGFFPAPPPGAPKVTTTLVNRSAKDLENLEVVALLFDAEENVSDISKTTVLRLAAGETQSVTLLLSPDSAAPARIEIFPHRNMFE